MKRMKKTNIGRLVLVQLKDAIVGAMIIDVIAGTNISKRIRLQTGEHAGEVRTLGEYKLLEFV